MSKSIIIGSNRGREDKVKEIYSGWVKVAVLTDASMIVRHQVGDGDLFETSSIRWGLERYDKVLYVQDTILCKDPQFFADYLNKPDDYYFCDGGMSYFATFSSKNGVPIPYTTTKLESIWHEGSFMRAYINQPHVKRAKQLLKDTNVFVKKWGRRVMVLENDYCIKFKSVWHPDMVEE